MATIAVQWVLHGFRYRKFNQPQPHYPAVSLSTSQQETEDSHNSGKDTN